VFLKALKMFTLAESCGAVESLASAPGIKFKPSVYAAYLLDNGITPGMIRISVGLENVQDLKDDID